jgi:hypothetical protein
VFADAVTEPAMLLAAALPIPSPAIASQELRPSNDLAMQSTNIIAAGVAACRHPHVPRQNGGGTCCHQAALAGKAQGGNPWCCRHER